MAEAIATGGGKILTGERIDPFPPSRKPARGDGLMSFASNPVVYGAMRLMFAPREQWTEDDYGRPVYVHRTDGGNLKGRTYYTIIVPSTDDEPAQIVAPEMAWQVCDSFGIDTAWLHMMLCAYASDRWRTDKADYGRGFVIDREQVIRALGIPAISRSEQDRRALEHITALRSINVQRIVLEPVHIKGDKAVFNFTHMRPHELWNITVRECGQMYWDFGGPHVPKYQTWQLVGREGLWAEAFLDGPSSLRQFGWISPEQFESLDRRSCPWAHPLTIDLAFRNRFMRGKPVTMSNADIIQLCGGDAMPSTKQGRYDVQLRVHNAILAMQRYGCELDFSEWPQELWPVPTPEEMDAADEAITGDGAGATARRMPRGYWNDWLHCRTTFIMPADVASACRIQRELPKPRPKPAPLTGDDVKRLREEQGLTQGELAEFLGVTQSFISHVEKGRRQLDNKQQKRLRSI